MWNSKKRLKRSRELINSSGEQVPRGDEEKKEEGRKKDECEEQTVLWLLSYLRQVEEGRGGLQRMG